MSEDITKNKIIIQMNDYSQWEMDVETIAQHRASCYESDFDTFMNAYEETVQLFIEKPAEIKWWLEDNMDWYELRARKISDAKPDYATMWEDGAYKLKMVKDEAKP